MTQITDREDALMEAAQCLWEEIDNALLNRYDYWERQRERLGTSALRYFARRCAPFVLEAHAHVLASRDRCELPAGMAYDFEFVPFVLNDLIRRDDLSHDLEPVPHEDWRLRLDTFLWKTELQDAAKWAYGLDINEVVLDPDNPPLDQPPEQYLEQVAASLDLVPLRS